METEGCVGKFLKRTKRRQEKHMTTEPNEKHIERLLDLMDLKDKGGTSNVPGRKLDLKNNKELEGDAISHYRSCVGLAMYIAQDRPDCKHSAKELARHIQKPRECDAVNLRILAQDLKAHRLCSVAALAEPIGRIDGYADSDWMGCEETRRSTSGCAIYVGGSLE